ncbi:hypothetical protein [Halobacterium bonnevillei]|uniref:Uncharacterized protein n=1 Tax=Halobacterium bonnevillei TaxID=2692200 RepID=A0A6B0SG88_9EURY|nr:hypothetical protein [Halobacterium bonnevillei]MXR20774.1 hypothetical protein [Halobacterium bonnevillei]
MPSDRAEFDRGTPRSVLRRGYWMQLWAALYALTTVYPNPGLTALVVVLVAVLAALIYATRPSEWRESL